MIHQTMRLSAIAFCAAALASLIPLSSAGAAQSNTRHHVSAGHAAQARILRGGHRFASVGRRVHAARRYGYRRHYVVGGSYPYPYYSGGSYIYGYTRPHSCWWYYRYDPADLPSWCATYSYDYDEPAYGYGFAFGAFGRHHHRRHNFAFGASGVRPIEGRAASVSGFGVQSGASSGVPMHSFQGGMHNFGGAAHITGGGGGAHFGGGHRVH
jgi:hypothetical protein